MFKCVLSSAFTQVTQTQEEITAELSTTLIDEPSQSELEEELNAILEEPSPRKPNTVLSNDSEDEELERELQRVLDLSGDGTEDSTSIDNLLDGKFENSFSKVYMKEQLVGWMQKD